MTSTSFFLRLFHKSFTDEPFCQLRNPTDFFLYDYENPLKNMSFEVHIAYMSLGGRVINGKLTTSFRGGEILESRCLPI